MRFQHRRRDILLDQLRFGTILWYLNHHSFHCA
jgi:hypothetical protein